MSEKRLIDANALIAEHCSGCAADIQAECKTDPICGSMMWIVEAPTVDAVEVVHGKWLNAQVEVGDPFGYGTYEIDVFVCSACGVHFDVSECRNYCPNCGAKMDGGNEDV